MEYWKYSILINQSVLRSTSTTNHSLLPVQINLFKQSYILIND